jgi:hypothetical protein
MVRVPRSILVAQPVGRTTLFTLFTTILSNVSCIKWGRNDADFPSDRFSSRMKAKGKGHVSFPDPCLFRPATALQADPATPRLNVLIFGCECVQSCVLSTTLKDADIPRRLNSRAREKYGLVHGCYISDDELTAVSSSLHKVKFGSCS